MGHTNITDLKAKFEDGDRPIGEDFKNFLDSSHNTYQDTDVTITGSLSVSGNALVKGATTLRGPVSLKSSLTVDEGTVLKSTLSVTGATSLNSDLSVVGHADLLHTLDVAKATNLKSTLGVVGATTLASTLDVTDAAILQNTLTVGSSTSLQGTLHAHESATFEKNVYIKGNLRVDGNAYLSAGGGGAINVGDSSDDSLYFHADVASSVYLDQDKQYDLGAESAKWSDFYVNNIIVDGLVDGRDISEDGKTLDSTHATVSALSANWSSVYSSVKDTSGSWDSVYASANTTSGSWDSVYASANATSADWDSVYLTTKTNSAWWDDNAADITAIATTSANWDSVYTSVNDTSANWDSTHASVLATSANWDSVYTSVNDTSANWDSTHASVLANSAYWDLNSLEDLDDVNTTGVENNSILRYDQSSAKWVASTTEDTRAAGSITVLDGNNSAWHNATVILIDNDGPVNTVTFKGDRDVEHGNNFEENNWSYTFSYSGVTTNSHAAEVLANVINFASANNDLAITAEAVNDVVNLSQDVAGEGGNTDITGGLVAMGLIAVNNFTGGENPDAFEDLDDTPGSYSTHAGEFVKVNSTEDGVEFIPHDTSGWDSTKSTVQSTSGDWSSVYSFVASDSATNNTGYNRTTFVNASGDIIDGTLSLTGDISAKGDVYLNDSSLRFSGGEIFSSTDSANSKSVYTSSKETSGNWDSVHASTNATSGSWDSVYASANATSGSWDSVYASSNATSANWDSVYASANATSGSWDSVYASANATSANWDSVYTSTKDTSANWDSVYTSTKDTSANWDSVYTSVTDTSANWDSVYTSVTDTSANWDSTHASVLATSADWDSVYTSVNDTSANWDSVYTSVNDTSANWDSVYTSVTDTSANWDSVYTSVTDTSANWDSTHASVLATSANWDSVYTSVNDTSANWDSVYTSVNDTSANWDSTHASVLATSANWDSVYTSVTDTSANWDSTHASVLATSADWDSVYTWVNSDSATNNTDYNRTTFVNASGDVIDGTLSLTGDLSAQGDVYLSDASLKFNGGEVFTSVDSINSKSVYNHINAVSGDGIATLDVDGKLLTDQIPELSITRVHMANNPSTVELLNPGTGIQVGDVVVVVSTHDNLIAMIDDPAGTYDTVTKDYTGYAKLALPDGLVQTVNGKPGPSVVLNPDDLVDDATAHKFVSQDDIDDWTSVHTHVKNLSAEWEESDDIQEVADDVAVVAGVSASWDSVYASANATSGSWDSVYASTNATSGSWDSVYASANATSGSWDSVYTSVNDTSASWDSVYTWVNSDSATNNTDYNSTTFVNATGDTMTGSLDIVGGELSVGGNITMAGDLIHLSDTGTKISFNNDIVSLEANGDEFIKIDGQSPTPDAVVINDQQAIPIDFQVKALGESHTFYIESASTSIGIGTSALTHKFNVKGTSNFLSAADFSTEGIRSGGDVVINTAVGNSTQGKYISAGEELHSIFSINSHILGDQLVEGNQTVVGELSANHVTAVQTLNTYDNGAKVTGITTDINIGGHILHIVNGLIIDVTDE